MNKITGPWFKFGRILGDFQLRLAGAEGICSHGQRKKCGWALRLEVGTYAGSKLAGGGI